MLSHKLVLALFIFPGFGGRCAVGVSQCKVSPSLTSSESGAETPQRTAFGRFAIKSG